MSRSSTGKSCKSRRSFWCRLPDAQGARRSNWRTLGFRAAQVERYEKFHEPILIEPADCRLAAKTGKFKLNGKEYPFKMKVRRSVIVNLVGVLDKNVNCKVDMFEVNSVPLRSQVVTAACEIYVQQEWARANDLTGSIKLSEYGYNHRPDAGRLRGGHLTRNASGESIWGSCPKKR